MYLQSGRVVPVNNSKRRLGNIRETAVRSMIGATRFTTTVALGMVTGIETFQVTIKEAIIRDPAEDKQLIKMA